MAYSAEISRSNPMCFLFLVDQSLSMKRPFGGEGSRPMAEEVADALNRLIHVLVSRCVGGEYILDRYSIGVIGYGAEINLGFSGDLAGEVLRPVSQIGGHPLRIEERTKKGAGGLVEQVVKFPVWFEPVAAGKTPMCETLRAGCQVILDFVSKHPDCHPPIVINITDGAATDGDPRPEAAAVQAVTSSDGNALLFNIHISPEGATAILYPTDESGFPDNYARLLFRMSSHLPVEMLEQAQVAGFSVSDGARGMAFNADLASVIMFLDIGTRATTFR